VATDVETGGDGVVGVPGGHLAQDPGFPFGEVLGVAAALCGLADCDGLIHQGAPCWLVVPLVQHAPARLGLPGQAPPSRRMLLGRTPQPIPGCSGWRARAVPGRADRPIEAIAAAKWPG
jgi:hypothetical protein